MTDSFYHAEYSYGFLSFRTHDEAKIALDKVNDNTTVREAISTLINKQTDDRTKKFVEQVTSMLFQNHSKYGRSTLVNASWATPRPATRAARCDYRDHNEYFDDCPEFDDCPDEFDRDEWDSYSQNRGD